MAPGRLRTLRRAHGLSQKALARRLRLAPSYVSMLEAGQRRPSDKTVRRLCDLFNIDEHVLFLPLSHADEGEMDPPAPADELLCAACPYRATPPSSTFGPYSAANGPERVPNGHVAPPYLVRATRGMSLSAVMLTHLGTSLGGALLLLSHVG